jgi:Cu(I)/Ag(I) efflux system membrane fusion protein
MGGPATVRELGGGRYEASFGLEMGGTWQVTIAAHAPSGEALEASGALTVGSEGLRLARTGATRGASAEEAAAPGRAPATAPGAFAFPAERLQRIGVRTARAEQTALAPSVRASARVVFDETALADVSPRVSGWVESLPHLALGEPVERGQTLLTLYSPELYAAQLEYQQALASRARAQATARPERADAIVRAAERRLALLGVATADLAAIARRGDPLEALPLRAPVGGVVIEKSVVLGGAVSAGERLLRIAPRERIWLEAAIPEGDLWIAQEGAAVAVRLPADAEAAPRAGRIVRVLPALEAQSRTATARIVLDEDGTAALRPDMWASVTLEAEPRDVLAVPASAVLRAGERSFVFVADGGGRFEPRAVVTGLQTPDAVEIRSGLRAGEAVVSEGTYLIASESRLRAALSQW